ncbi:MAG: hypothetical protein ACFFD9_01680 [Candidatus Thorarchaeota archaeon]
MDEEEKKPKKRKKKDDYTELEFELGELEFEAKGSAKVVERMFYQLLEKLETGKLKAISSTVKELEEAVEEVEGEEEGEELEEEEEAEEQEEGAEEEPSQTELEPESSEGGPLEPPPTWDYLDTETPPETEPEREARETE